MRSSFFVCFTFLFLSKSHGAISPIEVRDALSDSTVQNISEVFGSNPQSYKIVKSIAFDESEKMQIRWRAIISLSEMMGKKSLEDLIKASENKDWFIRNASLIAINDVDKEAGLKIAKKLVTDKALVVRSAAVEVLSKYNLSEVRELLWEELNKPYNFNKSQSLWIRNQIVKFLSLDPLKKEKIYFASLSKDVDAEIRKTSEQIIKTIQ